MIVVLFISCRASVKNKDGQPKKESETWKTRKYVEKQHANKNGKRLSHTISGKYGCVHLDVSVLAIILLQFE
jgi:hypothetical protein